jgi:hypothetical protein
MVSLALSLPVVVIRSPRRLMLIMVSLALSLLVVVIRSPRWLMLIMVSLALSLLVVVISSPRWLMLVMVSLALFLLMRLQILIRPPRRLTFGPRLTAPPSFLPMPSIGETATAFAVLHIHADAESTRRNIIVKEEISLAPATIEVVDSRPF